MFPILSQVKLRQKEKDTYIETSKVPSLLLVQLDYPNVWLLYPSPVWVLIMLKDWIGSPDKARTVSSLPAILINRHYGG